MITEQTIPRKEVLPPFMAAPTPHTDHLATYQFQLYNGGFIQYIAVMTVSLVETNSCRIWKYDVTINPTKIVIHPRHFIDEKKCFERQLLKNMLALSDKSYKQQADILLSISVKEAFTGKIVSLCARRTGWQQPREIHANLHRYNLSNIWSAPPTATTGRFIHPLAFSLNTLTDKKDTPEINLLRFEATDNPDNAVTIPPPCSSLHRLTNKLKTHASLTLDQLTHLFKSCLSTTELKDTPKTAPFTCSGTADTSKIRTHYLMPDSQNRIVYRQVTENRKQQTTLFGYGHHNPNLDGKVLLLIYPKN